MTNKVIEMSTEEWQTLKFGPSATRKLKWLVVDTHLRVKTFQKTIQKFGQTISRDVTPALEGFKRAFTAK